MQINRRTLKDRSWLHNAFLVSQTELDEYSQRNRFFSTARFKPYDTTPGGNICINPPPQFTDSADITVPGIFDRKSPTGSAYRPSTGTKGMGRYYSEAIDDNSRIISIRFGVPRFNSMTTFFTGFYNAEAGTLARTGRSPSLFFRLGQIAGFLIPLIAWPIFAINLVGNAWAWLMQKPSSRYYYLKPTMPMYWNAVQGIVNLIAVNKGIVPRFLDTGSVAALGDRYTFTKQDIERFNDLLPDIYMENGSINVYALATKGQRLLRQMYKQIEKDLGKIQSYDELHKYLVAIDKERLVVDSSKVNLVPSYSEYVKKWTGIPEYTPKEGSTPPADQANGSGNTAKADYSVETPPAQQTDIAGFTDFLEAELDDGSQFVTFRVDAEGSVGESFSNSVGESEIASKINSISSSSRSTSFNFAGGNVSDGLVGGLIQGAVGAVKDFAQGLADGVSMSGLAALGGSAFVDIPKHWQSSTANLPRMSYNMQLVSPYGNKVSQLFNIYIPLSMLLAGVLPLSTGRQSYTSPFILELYDRGRAQTRLGMIDQLSITRGTSNLAFNNEGEPMAVDISFSVIDLSSIMHMPIVQGFTLGSPLSNVFDDDNTFTDYMAVLGGLTLNEQIYTSNRLKIALTRATTNMSTWFSKAHAANFLGDTAPGRLASIFYTGIANR